MIVTKRGSGTVDAAVSGAQVVAGRDQLREPPNGGQTDGIEAYGKIVWTRRLDAGVKSGAGAEGPTGPRCRFPPGDGD